RGQPVPLGKAFITACEPLLQFGVGLERIPIATHFGGSACSRPLGRHLDGNLQQHLCMRYRQPEPVDLQLPDPAHHIAVHVLTEPSSLVGGVRGDVTVQQHHVVLDSESFDLGTCVEPVECVQHSHAVHRCPQIAVLPVQCFPNQIGMHTAAVAGKGHRGHARPLALPCSRQFGRQCTFSRSVEPFDHHKSSHASSLPPWRTHRCGSGPTNTGRFLHHYTKRTQ